MNPTERTPLSWILKNREKQEKQEKGFLSVFFVFICFPNKKYLRSSPNPTERGNHSAKKSRKNGKRWYG
ncbi:MAG: hypothetical protein IJ892_13515 [Prevotella sp.]|nr:hypothetical protein [Prevotella sp.]